MRSPSSVLLLLHSIRRGLPLSNATWRGMAVTSSKKSQVSKKGEDIESPRMQAVLAMLRKPEVPNHTRRSMKDKLREEDFALKEHARHLSWWRDMDTKLRLQKMALAALPENLRHLAEQPDFSHPPPNRKFMLDSAPEVYRDQ